jgi:hypothetical protein
LADEMTNRFAAHGAFLSDDTRMTGIIIDGRSGVKREDCLDHLSGDGIL